MSLFCSISGTQPLHPVVSSKSGHVYEKDLILKALANNDGKDPITAEQLAEDDLIQVKTAPGQPTAPPRAPTFTSVPSLLHTLQQEWDSTMLECLELRRESSELRQELSHALYKEDAAMRVLARVTRERDEAREALASVQATLGPGYSASAPAPAATGGAEDAQMDVEEPASSEGLPADAKQRVEQTAATLSAGRKKRKPSPEAATIDEVKAFAQGTTIPSVHTTKPPGVSALTLAKNGELFVSGGMDKNVIVFDRSTSKPVATLKGHTKKVTAVLASTEQADDLPSFLVSASLDKSVRVWTPNGKKTAYDCSTNLSLGAEVNALALHPSNSLAVAALADGTWAVIDLAAGDKAAVVLTGALPAGAAEGTANSAVAFHPDGGMFGVGSSDAKIRVFEISSGKCAAEFDGDAGSGPVTSLSFSENGYTLASSAQGSQQVKIWDLRKLSNSANIDLDEGVTASVVAFDPSAQFLAVVGSDARVYAYKSWELLAKSDDNAAELTSAAWGPNAHELLVAGLDRTVRVLSKPAAE